jgi:hypothetical protein
MLSMTIKMTQHKNDIQHNDEKDAQDNKRKMTLS